MKKHLPFLIIMICLVLTVFSLFGENGFRQISVLEHSLEKQRERNEQLRGHINALRRQIKEVRTDKRALEKLARDELGMARPKEKIFFFDKKSEPRE